MGMQPDCARGSLNILKLFKVLKYRRNFSKMNEDYFWADGTTVFIGPQGSGKTLSAVKYVKRILEKYPKCKLVTNLWVRGYESVTVEQYIEENKDRLYKALRCYLIDEGLESDTEFKIILSKEQQDLKEKLTKEFFMECYKRENRIFPFYNNDDLLTYRNGYEGVVFLIDEIQVYMNSLQSKNINLDVMTLLCQQRKNRLHIVGTCQVFGRMAKGLREQFSNIVVCNVYFTFLQRNRMIDKTSLCDENTDTSGGFVGTPKETFWWLHDPEDYGSYDTYVTIQNSKFSPAEEMLDIYRRDSDYICQLKN